MKLRRILIFLASTFSILVLALAFAVWFLFFRGCGGNAEAVSLLRALPKEQLASVYNYIYTLDVNRASAAPITMLFPPDTVPRELVGLNPKYLQVSGGTTRIHISGCYDDKVYLFFHGLELADGKKSIILSPGEAQDPETLWEQ